MRSSRSVVAASLLALSAACGSGSIAAGGASPQPTEKDFDRTRFSAASTKIDNPWFPLAPGTQFVYQGQANRGEGLSGLEVLTGRIASKRLGRPVHPRLDAEGFRAHQKESLEELALKSAEEAKRTRHPQLLPPLSPGERRLVHLALAEDPDVETESEGEGFLKRVAVKLKSP